MLTNLLKGMFFYNRWSMVLNPHKGKSKASDYSTSFHDGLVDSYSKLIDSIAGADDKTLEKMGNSQWAFFEGKPYIKYEIITSSKTRVFNFDFPASRTSSPLFDLLTTSLIIHGNQENQPNK